MTSMSSTCEDVCEDDVVSAEVESGIKTGAGATPPASRCLKRGQLVRVTANLVRRLP